MNRDHTSNMIESNQMPERHGAQERIGHQVKIRGFRILPREIESVIEGLSGVKQCTTVVRENSRGDHQLIAYVAGEHPWIPSVTELREILKEKLPSYMIPAMLITLESMPWTPDGKVDHDALPTPDPALLAYGEVFVEPRTPSEELLAEIWSDVLGVTLIGANDNFFDLGGHSLLIGEVISRVNAAFQVKLPMNTLFIFPTIADLALVVEARLVEEFRGILREHADEQLERLITWPDS